MNLSPLLLLLLGELLLLTTATSAFLLIRAWRRRKHDRSAALSLISEIRKRQSSRLEETRELAKRFHGSDETGVGELAESIQTAELAFYQQLIDARLERNTPAFTAVRDSFETAVDCYRELWNNQDAGADDVTAGELEALTKERDRLTEELRITMDTMGRMLSEYASMYAGGSVEELDKERIASMYRPEAATYGDDETTDYGRQGEPRATPVSPQGGSPSPGPEQGWIDEAAGQLPGRAEAPLPGSEEEDDGLDETTLLSASEVIDDLVSLDVRTAGG